MHIPKTQHGCGYEHKTPAWAVFIYTVQQEHHPRISKFHPVAVLDSLLHYDGIFTVVRFISNLRDPMFLIPH